MKNYHKNKIEKSKKYVKLLSLKCKELNSDL
jgi:hypothetical protein